MSGFYQFSTDIPGSMLFPLLGKKKVKHRMSKKQNDSSVLIAFYEYFCKQIVVLFIETDTKMKSIDECLSASMLPSI